MIIVSKKYYIDTLVKELGINNVNINNPTYIPIDDSFETIVKSHNQFITSVGLEISEEDQNLPYLYWTPKLHKSSYKHRFIAGSSKCTTKDLSCLLTKVLSTIKDGLVRYCNTKTSRNGVNNMWILKNSTSLLSSLDQLDVCTTTSVQTFDFSTLYTSIPHDLVHNAFRKKDGSVRYTHIKVTRAKGYFTHDINGSGDNMYTADNICKMIGFLIDNIFVQFGRRLFHQAIGIPMGINCAPLLGDLFLYSYENKFLDSMIRTSRRRLARSLNLCHRYVMILTSTLSIFHTFPATYHLALLMVCTFHSSLDMHDAARTMMISDIATSAWLINFCHKAEPRGLTSLSRNFMADIRISLRNTRGQSM